MRSRSRTAAALAAAITVVLTASACNGGDKTGGDDKSAGTNAAVKAVVNASDKKGGTVVYEASDTPDSFDPGNTYYGFVFNFSRLYARSLTTFPPAAGAEGNKVVPDLAEGLGTPSDGATTWTYKLRKGVKYSDGTEITSKDVKYAIERSNFARDVHSNGPSYFATYLKNNETPYEGPYKDKSDTGLKSIETPDDQTIVFKLKQPFAEFDYLLANPQSAPVPKAKDNGADYVKNIVSSGSYMFEKYEQDKEAVLVRNPHWDASTDPLRKQLPEKIVVKLKVNQETIDSNLKAGNTHIDIVGNGVAQQTQTELLTSKDPNTDNAEGGRLVYMAINQKVAPFDKLECRQAVQYAIDKVSVQTAFGGPTRGAIANTVLPTDIPGHVDFNTYETAGNKGDETKAKAALTACGQPNGFETTITARNDRAGEVDMATAIQASLKKIGITVKIQQFPAGKYFSDYAGVPKFTEDNKIGLMMMQWGADWPSGFGFLQQVVHGDAIGKTGNTNLSQLNDPEINKMLNDNIATTDAAAREKVYGDIDKKVMDRAVIVPLTYFKVLHYRSPKLSNVVSNPAWSGQYDYLNIGLK
ncbi:ABC transporter substrate-binding protein [Streptomyces sp. NBC_01310]|uniref:ABC transporter substrate-binding protein n=1 Tax=unclassified Streptomyces TaxID=2593676 RepID=UPI002DD95583|nr:ABC transporter substrate-binding protein [Streptomyces sp. NBC_01294]WRZ56959.1 ABC transporter substrate-binding protein [Streptomyces sp. NBC_01294]WSJ61351.1 ABC transporter substrate-binding protein [Streptomyces sp. NBC_01310]